MITVIIPTLWQCDRLVTTLQELSECPEVGEVLLFDNTANKKRISLPKLQHILEGRNTYVGAPWNKGAAMAKYDHLLVLNDDTWMDWSYLAQISEQITDSRGMLGIAQKNYQLKEAAQLQFLPVTNRPNAFACLFFIHKSSWTPIPDEIKIWATDCWLFTKNQQAGRSNYYIQGLPVIGYVSKTVGHLKQHDSDEFNRIIKQDLTMKAKYNLI